MKSPGTVYLLHFSAAFKHARHYLGWTRSLAERITRHREGRGARLIEIVTAAGITFDVAKTWKGGRDLERRMKGRGLALYCPLCRPRVREPEMPMTPAAALKKTAARIAGRTRRAYSFDRYGFISWRACCTMLLRQGRSVRETEGIMRSRATRAAADLLSDRHTTSKHLEKYLATCPDWKNPKRSSP